MFAAPTTCSIDETLKRDWQFHWLPSSRNFVAVRVRVTAKRFRNNDLQRSGRGPEPRSFGQQLFIDNPVLRRFQLF